LFVIKPLLLGSPRAQTTLITMEKIDLSNLQLDTKTAPELSLLRSNVYLRLRYLATTRWYRLYIALWAGLFFCALLFVLCFLNPPPDGKVWLLLLFDAICFVLCAVVAQLYFGAKRRFKTEVEDLQKTLNDINNQLLLRAG